MLGLGTTTIAVEGDDGTDVTRHEISVDVVEGPEVPYPLVNIIAPEDDDSFQIGTSNNWPDCDSTCIQVDLDGLAWDFDNNELTGPQLEWTAHSTSNDEYYELAEGTGDEVLIPTDAIYMEYFVISLTATDDEGVSKTETVEIRNEPIVP